jgi:serine/threonine protein kinase
MKPERWQKVKRICEDALECEAGEREAFLATACAGDDQLRKEVDSFLSGGTGKDGFIETPAFEMAAREMAKHEAAADLSGESFLHYHIAEKIGTGGMGEVYRARDDRLKRDVAIKVLPDIFTNDPERLRRFDREATLLASLNHPNVATIHAVEQAGTMRFLVLELVQGETLTQRLTRGPLPLEEALEICRQVAEGLEAAHEKGIIHRDLKPANVKVTPEGRVKVLDFGLAKAIEWAEGKPDSLQATTVTSSGTSAWHIAGTPGYMSPEQARGTDVDQRTDVWAFGCLLFELLSGKPAFKRETVSDTIAAVLEHEPDWQVLPTGTPAAVRELLQRCLQKDVNRRLNSIREIRSIIEESQRRLNRRRFIAIARRPRFAIPAAAFLLLLGFLGVRLYLHNSRVHWVREQAIPEISRLLDSYEFNDAFRMLRRAEAVLPNDPTLRQIHQNISVPTSFRTNPPGAEVWATGYAPDDNDWLRLGTTPFTTRELPWGHYRLRIEKPGFRTILGSGEVRGGTALEFDLDPKGTIPPEMVRVPGGFVSVPGLGIVRLGSFLIDRYEITNRQFKEFIDGGGYQKRDYWKQDFVQSGRKLSWEEAMQSFRDSTGRPGPSTWVLGEYPQGHDDYPVNGMSWYEAAAYAEFADKQLPTIYHWEKAASPGWFAEIAVLSNFGEDGPARVGSYQGIGPYGTLDMAGNVREWCWNEIGGKRSTRGGAWNEPIWIYSGLDSRAPWDRSDKNGIRCVRYDAHAESGLQAPLTTPVHDFRKDKPVSEEVFRLYRSLYAYDPSDLDARVEGVDGENSYWKREKVSFAAAYGDERVYGYFYIPKAGTPPYQTIIYAEPGMSFRFRSPQPAQEYLFSFLVKSGRAFLLPVLKGQYQRRYVTAPAGSNENRDRLILLSKDFRRSIDYLVSRPDVDRDRLGVYGLSYGACQLPVLAVGEQRLKAAALISVGLYVDRNRLPEADPFNFVSHFQVPTLMINGRSDFGLPLETSIRPMFRLLGAPENDKRQRFWEGSHADFRDSSGMVIKETVDWFDRYLGPVK